MFLASDTAAIRERYVLKFLKNDPSISLLVATVNFEWTVSRAVLFISSKPNRDLRSLMRKYHSLDGYKQLWRDQVLKTTKLSSLPKIVRNWSALKNGFMQRNRIVHGKDGCTTRMAAPHVEAILKSVAYVDDYCEKSGYNLHQRMPVRRSQ